MKLLKYTPDYISVLKYSFVTALFIIFNRLEQSVMPYSIFILLHALNNGYSLIITPILHVASFLILSNTGLTAVSAISSVFFVIVTLLNKKFRHKASYELTAYTLIAMLSFIILGDTNTVIPLEKRIFVSLINVMFALLGTLFVSGLKKGLKFKWDYEELASACVFLILTGVGVCNLISPYVWKGFSAFMILLVCFIYKKGISSLLSSVLSISLALHSGNLNYIAVFLVWALVCETLTPVSRFCASVALVGTDYVINSIFSVYGVYDTSEFLSVLIGVVVFFIIPKKPLLALKERLYSFREKQLSRVAINRNRLMLSNRLFEISGVFNEIASAFAYFKDNGINEQKAKASIEKDILEKTCVECSNYYKCKAQEEDVKLGVSKMIDIGFAKGKLSLIDMPKELGDKCIHPGNVIYGINKLLAEYRTAMIENMSLNTGRDLISAEAEGIAEILKTLALNNGTMLKYQSRLERKLSNVLLKNGFSVSELLIYGDENRVSVGLVLTMKEFSLEKLNALISDCLNTPMELKDKADITEQKCYLSFERSAKFDAVFGLSCAKKDGSSISGDTHSVLRISTDKFLLALSDGMGSGEHAESISSVSLSLIESFYKAGMESNLILSTVNKLLAVNTEDSFTALDVAVIDLNFAKADFIKFGSPYGFIIGPKGIRIVEGSSLPLGILNDLKPSVCNAELSDGDIIILLTDGVSDAIGNSSDIIDFLRTQPAKNPQSLSDNLLKHALELSGGQKKDDMTVLAVRIFDREKQVS